MRLLVINPNTTQAMTEAIGVDARAHASAGTHIDATSPTWGPASIETHAEEAIAAVAVLEVIAAHRGDIDGAVIACFGDPGLEAARELATAPVVGIAEAAMLLALPLGHRFSLIGALDRARPLLEDVVHRHRLSARCASIRTTGLTVLEIDRDPSAAARAVGDAAVRAIREDGAEVICLGCAGMGQLDDEVRRRVDVPVINPVGAGIRLIEAVLGLTARTSRTAVYQPPMGKRLTGQSTVVDALQAAFCNQPRVLN